MLEAYHSCASCALSGISLCFQFIGYPEGNRESSERYLGSVIDFQPHQIGTDYGDRAASGGVLWLSL